MNSITLSLYQARSRSARDTPPDAGESDRVIEYLRPWQAEAGNGSGRREAPELLPCKGGWSSEASGLDRSSKSCQPGLARDRGQGFCGQSGLHPLPIRLSPQRRILAPEHLTHVRRHSVEYTAGTGLPRLFRSRFRGIMPF